MGEIVIKVPGYECERCGHQWVARGPRSNPKAKGKGKEQVPPKPRICPSCKSAWWDTPREG